MKQVDYIVYESLGDRLEKINRRMFVAIILLIVMLVATNGCWLYYESQFKDIETTKIEAEQKADGPGKNIIVGGDYVIDPESNDN